MEQIVAYVDARRDRFLDDLSALVNVDCGTHNKAGVDAVGAAMRRRLEQAGLAVETVPVDDYGDFLVGRMSGSGKARILIVGHLHRMPHPALGINGRRCGSFGTAPRCAPLSPRPRRSS